MKSGLLVCAMGQICLPVCPVTVACITLLDPHRCVCGNRGNKGLALRLLVFAFTLTEIIRGGVKFSHNCLCYVDTIQWADIVHMKSNPSMDYPTVKPDVSCEYSCAREILSKFPLRLSG